MGGVDTELAHFSGSCECMMYLQFHNEIDPFAVFVNIKKLDYILVLESNGLRGPIRRRQQQQHCVSLCCIVLCFILSWFDWTP